MRTKKQIENKIVELREQTNEHMKNHLADNSGNEIYLRLHNKVQEEIFTLEWVLNK